MVFPKMSSLDCLSLKGIVTKQCFSKDFDPLKWIRNMQFGDIKWLSRFIVCALFNGASPITSNLKRILLERIFKPLKFFCSFGLHISHLLCHCQNCWMPCNLSWNVTYSCWLINSVSGQKTAWFFSVAWFLFSYYFLREIVGCRDTRGQLDQRGLR